MKPQRSIEKSHNKSLENIMEDMSLLYDQVRDGGMELKPAAELANIAGKYLKAYQLQLAERIFVSNGQKRVADIVSISNDSAAQIASSA